jgi:hypothetical protein
MYSKSHANVIISNFVTSMDKETKMILLKIKARSASWNNGRKFTCQILVRRVGILTQEKKMPEAL